MNFKFQPIAAALVFLAAGFIFGRNWIDVVVDFPSPVGRSQKSELGSTDSATKKMDRKAVTRSSTRTNPDRSFANTKYWKALIDSIYADPENPELGTAWWRFVEQLGADEIGVVMDRLCSKGYSAEMSSRHVILWKKWARLDPEAALKKIQDPGGLSFQSDPEYSGFTTKIILSNWFKNGDGSAAIRWIAEHPDVRGSKSGLSLALSGTDSFSKADKAVEFLSMIHDKETRLTGIESFLETLKTSKGFEGSFQWASSLEDKSLRLEIMSHMMENLMGHDDLDQVAAWLRANAGEDESPIMTSTMKIMSDRDFQSAATYFEGIEDQTMKKNALLGMIHSELITKQPDALLSIMDSHESLMTDDLVEQFIYRAYSADRSLAINNIKRIQNPQQRDKAYRTYMLSWLADDRNGALEWGSQNNTPESFEVVARALADLQKHGSPP